MEKRRTVRPRQSIRCISGGVKGERERSSKNSDKFLKTGNGSASASRDSDDVFKLKWNLQSQHLLNELRKVYDGQTSAEYQGFGEEGADVTLFSGEGGGCVSAHRVVLMLCSPYFQKLFIEVAKCRRKVGSNAVVILGNVPTAAHLHNLVRFIYTGEVNLSSNEEVEEFTKIARQFGLEGVSTLTASSSWTTGRNNRTCRRSILRNKLIGCRIPPRENDGGEHGVPFLSEENEDLETTTPVIRMISSLNDNVKKQDVTEDQEELVCKSEPTDDHHPYPDPGDGDKFMEREDDEGSNFSDDLRDNLILSGSDESDLDDPDVSCGGGSTPTSIISPGRSGLPNHFPSQDNEDELKLDPRTGKLRKWTRIEPLPEEEFKRDWRTKNILTCASNTTTIFYCPYGGKKCPAQIKIKTLRDGTKIHLKNAYDHANHRDPAYHFGLTLDQKQFVFECLQNGITQPANILLKFEMSSGGIPKPQKLKLNNMLARLKKKYPDYWKKKEPSKWPKRIRKRPDRQELPKKRGRPLGNSSVTATPSALLPLPETHSPASSAPFITPACTSSAPSSSSSVPVSSSSPLVNLPHHPNHFMGQTLFPLNLPVPTTQAVIPPHYPYDSNSTHFR